MSDFVRMLDLRQSIRTISPISFRQVAKDNTFSAPIFPSRPDSGGGTR